jgi:transforming growth factor-beta-induced protein
MRLTPRRFLAVAFAASLVLAGCGNDDDDETTSPDTTEAATDDGTMNDDAMEDAEGEGTIVDVAIAADDFETLVAAIEAAGLAETLSGPGPFTVFAPTDAAFAALPEGALEDLLADPDALADVLTYHVVAGEFYAADVVELDSAETVNGASVTIEVDGDTVMVDGAQVITTDIEASNGVIHVIDAVLLP